MSADGAGSDWTQRLSEVFARLIAEIITAETLREETGGDLSPTQLAGLRFIRCHTGCDVQELAAGLDVSHPAALKLLERLAKKRLVLRRTAARDRRRAELTLSRAGERMARAVCERQAARVRQILSEMPAADVEALGRGLRQFIMAALDNPEIIENACLKCGREHDPLCLLHQARLRFAPEQKAASEQR